MTEQDKQSIEEDKQAAASHSEAQKTPDEQVSVQQETDALEEVTEALAQGDAESESGTDIAAEALTSTEEMTPEIPSDLLAEEQPKTETKPSLVKSTIEQQLEAANRNAPETHKWFVVQVLSSHEKKVKKALEEQREHSGMNDLLSEILLPTEKVSEVKRGEQQIVEKRLWPGYLLVKMTMTDDSWSYVKGTPGVIDFLGGSQATPLTDQEVAEILSDLEKKRTTVTQRHKFQVGDRVKIIDGVFVNFIGTVTEVFHEKGRLNALVNIFGRDTQVDDLDFTQVEEITDEEEATT